MRKALTMLLILCFCLNANGTNYYVKSTGSDAANGLSDATAWQTLTKINSFFSSLSPGDSVLLKRGETFYGFIQFGRSGTAANPIKIGSYGTGSKPVITGFQILTWTALGGSIYESQALLVNALNMVTLNGVVKPQGRYPQSSYLAFETHIGTTSITDNTLLGSPNWTGAELVIRRRSWVLDRDSITSHVGTKISYIPNVASEPYDGYGYFIQNSASTLTYQNAWWYRKATKRLRIYSTTPPTAGSWKAANIDELIKNTGGFDYITLDNLSIQGANWYGVNTYPGSNIVVQNCDINFSGIDGVRFNNNSKVESCTISNSLNNGVTYSSGFDTVRNTTIYNSGMWVGMGASNAGTYVGVLATNTSSFLEYNAIRNSGYLGAYINGNNSKAKNNLVDSFCIVKDDGGGLYTNDLTQTGRQIIGNIIINGIGAPAGKRGIVYEVNGLYSDNQSSDVLMSGNTVANITNGYGAYLHGGPNDKLRNNTFYNNKVGLYIGEMVAGVTIHDSVTNNIFFGVSTSQMLSRIVLRSNRAPSTMGYFDSNYYCRPILEPNGINNSGSSTTGGVIAFTPGGTIPGYYSLDKWKLFNTEINSKKSPKGNDVIRFEYNASQVNKVINLQPYKYFTATGQAVKDFYTIAPYGSVILIRDSLLTTVVNQAPTVSSTLNHSITLPVSSTSLTATANDPEFGVITYAWTKNSGPATFTIVSPTAATTSITGLVAGTYLFQIIVTDIGGLKDTAFTQVIVNASIPVNAAPTVDAGTDVSITMPLDSYQLNADATDSDGSIISYAWTQISGPAGTIDNTAIQNPTITLTTAGKRTFMVTVTDDLAATGYDEVDITVYPSVVNASVIIADSINCNGGNASVVVSATGGTEPYTGTGTFVVTDGNIQYIVTDALGQKDTVNVTVTEPATLTLGKTFGTIADYLGSTTLTLTPTGGTPNYLYSLDNVNWYSSNIFSIVAGSYTARVVDYNGCTASTNFTVVQPPPPPNIWIHPGRGKKFMNLP